MSQKCMFDPQNIDNVTYDSEKFIKQYSITPDVYKRFINAINPNADFYDYLKEILSDWKIDTDVDKLYDILK